MPSNISKRKPPREKPLKIFWSIFFKRNLPCQTEQKLSDKLQFNKFCKTNTNHKTTRYTNMYSVFWSLTIGRIVYCELLVLLFVRCFATILNNFGLLIWILRTKKASKKRQCRGQGQVLAQRIAKGQGPGKALLKGTDLGRVPRRHPLSQGLGRVAISLIGLIRMMGPSSITLSTIGRVLPPQGTTLSFNSDHAI